jgi:hypothetical protein
MKTLLLAALLAIPALSQVPPVKCDAAITKLPTLRGGIRLRMPESDVVKSGVSEDPIRAFSWGRELESNLRVGGRPAFTVRTYDQTAAAVFIDYGYEGIAKNPDEFMRTLSASLNLPTDAWAWGIDRNTRVLACPEFTVFIYTSRNTVLISDNSTYEKVIRDVDRFRKTGRRP